ncbi:unnamed protein product [Brassicogethes aeneus]|uniref:Uncharacterized protein n=1 Tax=Brassicogethes aeneus TaxID=1431903 RepID=A0A9P0B0N9_BRAAE|nr:unnamed protein product [Brassicogethes aeneus]
MGNFLENNISTNMVDKFDSVRDFKFMDAFSVQEAIGLCFNDIYIPEEILFKILSFLEPKLLLKYSQVCKKWCNVIKSDIFWKDMFRLNSDENPGNFPWYVYYCYLTTKNFNNLLKNGNGAKEFKHWKIKHNGGDKIDIEKPPIGSKPLPDEPEFVKDKSCFVTSYQKGSKYQEIDITNKRLLRFIINKFKFPVYVSEWTAGRFDCSSVYYLATRLESGEDESGLVGHESGTKEVRLIDIDRVEWRKVELIFTKYPDNLVKIIFQHAGRDGQFWSGHYGAKMSGGVVKFLLHPKEI